MIKVFTNRSAGSDLFRVAYPDTGESGDAYDIHVQTGPIIGRVAWIQSSLSLCLNTAPWYGWKRWHLWCRSR